MHKVTIVGSLDYLEATIETLHNLNILHIQDHTKNEHADIGKPLAKASHYSALLLRIRSIIGRFSIEKQHVIQKETTLIEKKLTDIEHQLEKTDSTIKELQTQLTKQQTLLGELTKLQGLEIPLEAFSDYTTLTYFVGWIKDTEKLKHTLTGDYELYIGEKTIALFTETSKQEETQTVLRELAFSPITPIKGLTGSVTKNIEQTQLNIKKLEQELQESTQQQKQTVQKESTFLLGSELYLSKEIEKAEAPLRFATTERAFYINGWVPENTTKQAERDLLKISPHLYIHFEEPTHEEHIPVKLANKSAVKPFEFFMNLYTLPTYHEMDPTFLVFITFPLLFGFMLGDMGYGLVTLVLFTILRKTMPQAKAFFTILIWASIGTIFFGALFGEFFGLEEIGHYEIPHILSRAHDMMTLLFLAVAIGVIHLDLGLIMGFINDKKHHGFFKAFCGKFGWIFLQGAAALLGLSYTHTLTLSPLIGYAVLATAIAMIVYGEGIRGAVELPSIFSNILSYGRLMAIGLSSVMLAIVINESAFELFHKGIGGIIAGILILIIGHTINIGLGLMGSFLHSLRLHYVEFFTKFFHGGGKKYNPFGSVE